MFNKVQKYIPSPNILSWLILFVSVFVSYSKLQNEIGYYISSDTLGVSGLYYDLFLEHGDLKNWYIASSPSLFPDIFFYFLVLTLFKSHLLMALLVYGFLQITVVVYLLSYIYKKIAPDEYKKYAWFIPLFISMYFMEGFWFSHDIMFGFFLTAHCYHIGPFITSLLLLAVFLSNIPKSLKYTLVILLSALGMFSDKLFVVMLYVPFTIAFLCSMKRENLKYTIVVIICLIVGAALGIGSYEYLSQNKVLTFLPPHRIYDLGNAIPSLTLFFWQMLGYLKLFGLKSLQILFTFLSIIGCIFFYFKNRKKAGQTLLFFMVFYVFFCLSVFFAPIVNGNYTGIDTIRYNVYPFFLASIVFALYIAFVLINKLSRLYTNVVKPVLVCVLIILSINFSITGFKEYINYYPDDVAEIDGVVKQYHLTKGISGYWTAKKTTLLSKQHIKLLSVHIDVCLSELGNNINSFYEGDFDFVVANDLMPEVVSSLFKIRDTVTTKHYTILLVDKFIYPKGKYAPETIVK